MGKRLNAQVLSYPLRLPDEMQEDALRLLDASKQVVNQTLTRLWPALDCFGELRPTHSGPAWKQVTELLGSPDPHGNRQWRCEAETVGRILRAQAQRKRWFALIVPILSEGLIRPTTNQRASGKNRSAITQAITAVRRAMASADQGESREDDQRDRAGQDGQEQEEISFATLQNVVEQCCNFYLHHDRFPATYEDLQPLPLLRVGLLTYAGDDGGEQGQAYRLTLEQEAGALHLRLRFPDEAGVWRWQRTATTLTLPACVRERLTSGTWLAPTLREIQPATGERFAVLDCCLAVAREEVPRWEQVDRVLGADWGVHTLFTATALDAHGGQIGRPFFINTGGFDGRQARTRRQIDHLKKKIADYQADLMALSAGATRAEAESESQTVGPMRQPRAVWLTQRIEQYQQEMARCWGKYERRNRALAHLASNVLLLLVQVHGCRLLSLESLATLKTTGRGKGVRGKWRHWRNNATIRGEIWRLLRYKCHLYGVRFHTERPRGTSHTCPRCGRPAQTYRSAAERNEAAGAGKAVTWGRWLSCEQCGYNADRDYCASVNIARLGVACLLQWQARHQATTTSATKQTEQTKPVRKVRSCVISDPIVKPASYTGAGAVLLLPPPGSHARPQVSGKRYDYPGWCGSVFLQSSQPQALFLRLCG
jgi:putative transposase